MKAYHVKRMRKGAVLLLDHHESVPEEKQFLIDCIVNTLHTADVQKIRCIYQFVLHIVK